MKVLPSCSSLVNLGQSSPNRADTRRNVSSGYVRSLLYSWRRHFNLPSQVILSLQNTPAQLPSEVTSGQFAPKRETSTQLPSLVSLGQFSTPKGDTLPTAHLWFVLGQLPIQLSSQDMLGHSSTSGETLTHVPSQVMAGRGGFHCRSYKATTAHL